VKTPGSHGSHRPCSEALRMITSAMSSSTTTWRSSLRPCIALGLPSRVRDHDVSAVGQYIPTGRTSTAPPMRAAGIRAAKAIAASLSSASNT
jgi:hypothetical protein